MTTKIGRGVKAVRPSLRGERALTVRPRGYGVKEGKGSGSSIK